ncbi:MAG: UPF0280 family protein [Chloroflexi bacterium]|nr:UPF0280 family protein [Chloroflexota bacterium]
MYELRTYRDWVNDKELVSFSVVIKETDLHIRARRDLTAEALTATQRYRADLESYIKSHPIFLTTLRPFEVEQDAPPIVKEMSDATREVGVGPMAAVAGAIAERVGKELLPYSDEVIVENGGDIFLKTSKERFMGVYAGESKFTRKIAFSILPEETPLGVCTSSGTVGHSLSFGYADAVIVFSPSTSLADAAATAIGNRVRIAEDIPEALEFAQGIKGLKGIAIIKGDNMGVWGQIKLANID